MGLKGIPFCISPDLLHVLASMGHGDEIVLADAHFPTSATCKASGAREIRCDGVSTSGQLLEAVLRLLPLDTQFAADECAIVMRPVDPNASRPPVWTQFEKAFQNTGNDTVGLMSIERFSFYERAQKAYAIVATGEIAPYGNIILKKGLAIEI